VTGRRATEHIRRITLDAKVASRRSDPMTLLTLKAKTKTVDKMVYG